MNFPSLLPLCRFILFKKNYLFVWVFLPTGEFSLIWRRLLCRWRVSNYDLCSALIAIEQPFIMFTFEDPWHSHIFPCGWQWSCNYLFLRLRSVVDGVRTPTSRARRKSQPMQGATATIKKYNVWCLLSVCFVRYLECSYKTFLF